MPTVTFRVHYATQWGEELFLEHHLPADKGSETRLEQQPMRYAAGGSWTFSLTADSPGTVLDYRYVFRGRDGEILREPAFRRLPLFGNVQAVFDEWFSAEWPEAAFLRQAFAGVIFQPVRTSLPQTTPISGRRLRITLRAARVPQGHRVCVTGSHPLLGRWDPAQARPMSGEHYPLWELDLPAEEFAAGTDFKFGFWDERSARLVQFEAGANRWIAPPPANADGAVFHYERFRHETLWKGAGVAIPVFSLRSRHGYGIGEFSDLAPFAEWAARCGMHLVQLLPVNDTTSDFNRQDSYPYKAISTAALHPIYLNLERVFRHYRCPLPDGYAERRDALNRLPEVDYEAVLRDKFDALRQLFAQVSGTVLADAAFRAYVRAQAGWLQPYAAFCRLRDRHGTADFTQWGPDATYRPRKIRAWFHDGALEYEEVMFHCWIQFHLDRQLQETLAAGHRRGVAFKGDLPIGINRSSVEAWTEPELFRMDRQTGAPPDAFAVLGQNWGFPTYDWERMEADGYAWWRRRLQRMSTAFDALRIDHILGFFRIWEIPRHHREGILGHYHPALPLRREEIQRAGFARKPEKFGVGAVAATMLPEFFGSSAAKVGRHLLARDADGFYRLRPAFAAAEARQAWYARAGLESVAGEIEAGLTRLGYEVLFLEEPNQPDRFHPRINLMDTAVFQALPVAEQQALRALHDDFFFRRHSRFWEQQAMKKLPALMDASPMLICGEDLGMVPDSVPVVLRRLGLLSLEVQRWPKRLGQRLGCPADYPYLSVCTTSTHDMSTLRGWWEEDPELRQYFWTKVMERDGVAPAECSPEICRFIIEQNLAAASMWCILPLQDWLGIDPRLRRPVAAEERINVPADPRHYWCYRMHLTIEQLLEAETTNRTIAGLIAAADRGRSDRLAGNTTVPGQRRSAAAEDSPSLPSPPPGEKADVKGSDSCVSDQTSHPATPKDSPDA